MRTNLWYEKKKITYELKYSTSLVTWDQECLISDSAVTIVTTRSIIICYKFVLLFHDFLSIIVSNSFQESSQQQSLCSPI